MTYRAVWNFSMVAKNAVTISIQKPLKYYIIAAFPCSAKEVFPHSNLDNLTPPWWWNVAIKFVSCEINYCDIELIYLKRRQTEKYWPMQFSYQKCVGEETTHDLCCWECPRFVLLEFIIGWTIEYVTIILICYSLKLSAMVCQVMSSFWCVSLA